MRFKIDKDRAKIRKRMRKWPISRFGELREELELAVEMGLISQADHEWLRTMVIGELTQRSQEPS